MRKPKQLLTTGLNPINHEIMRIFKETKEQLQKRLIIMRSKMIDELIDNNIISTNDKEVERVEKLLNKVIFEQFGIISKY